MDNRNPIHNNKKLPQYLSGSHQQGSGHLLRQLLFFTLLILLLSIIPLHSPLRYADR